MKKVSEEDMKALKAYDKYADKNYSKFKEEIHKPLPKEGGKHVRHNNH